MSLIFRAVGGLARRLLGRGRAERSMDSVVVLFDGAPEFSDPEIVNAIRRAFPGNVPEMLPASELPPPEYAADAPPCRSVPFAVNRRVLGLLIGSFPYTRVSGQGQDAVLSRSTMLALVSHQGWIAVDFIGGERPDDVYGLLGRVAAELVKPGATLVFLPTLSLAAHPSPELVAAMREGHWIDRLEILAEPVLHLRPVDDPALAAAAEEARARFDEFVRAFDAAAGAGFSAKFPFAEGEDVEHMWIAVESINGDAILGTLGNEPGVITNIAEGDPVTRTLDELEDWLYMDGEAMVGGFSVRVMLGEGDG